MALKRKWMPSPNFSFGRFSDPRLIVLHTTEGARTIESLGNFFSDPNVKASSHAGVDDQPNMAGVYVLREHRAWTQREFNSVSVSLEICAFSRWPTSEWLKHPDLLANAAAWIAEEAAFFNIPIVHLTPAQAQGAGRGVCQHVDISGPGGHTDCGPGFPMDRVLQMARGSVEESKTTWYFLQDLTAVHLNRGQRMYYGGWELEIERDEKAAALTKGFRHSFRIFRDNNFPSPYFIDNSAFVQEIYGGWKSEAGRDRKRQELEKELGHTLRPFSENRTAAQGGVPWGCKNLQAP